MTPEEVFRWFGLDPDDARAHHHHIDLVTEEAKRECAEYLEMLSRATVTIHARLGEPVVATLDMTPVTPSRETEPEAPG
jgi:hypothetical protein